MEGKPIKLRRRKKEKKEDEDKEPKNPVYEEPIVAEEFVPLLDDSIAKTDGKGLLNVRVIFVIGKLVFFFYYYFQVRRVFFQVSVIHPCSV